MGPFKAFLIEQRDGGVSAGFVDFDEARLDPGEVTVRVAYSSINYKDALAATGRGAIVRRFPCVGGIDLAGTVEASADARYTRGQRVICTSYDLGVSHHGGYAEFARVPGDWVVPLPEGLTLSAAMALGTAGFTAALAVVRLQALGLSAGQGPVAVTGATGGVGSIAVDLLAGQGHEVCAITGKRDARDYLARLGATEVLARADLEPSRRPLDKARWAGACDSLGGEALAWLLRSTQPWGAVAACGLAASSELHTTVMPFILRGVSLVGIDSAYCPMALRAQVWARLAGDLRVRHLEEMTRAIDFHALPDAFADYLDGRVRGRTVVRIGGER